MISREDIIAKIEAGASLDELLQEAVRPELSELLDRCAWVRSFDADVFELLRADVPSDVTFEEVIASPEVRAVSGRDGAYRLSHAARDAALARLVPAGQVSDSLRDLSVRLADYFARRKRSLDLLDQLVVADPDAAVDLLRKLYRDADKDFDAPRCQTILNVVDTRSSVSNWKVVAEENRLERYLVARTYWRDRYRQASRFLVPRGTHEAFVRLLAPEPPHTLQLFAMGGMGKTIHLYELIARRAVPEPRRLSAALVDFDLTQLGNVLREPWLLLVEIAHQLNQQLPEPLMDDFLKQYSRLRARLLLPQFAAEASLPGQLVLTGDEERERLQENVREEFYRLLKAPADAGQVLIAFDTLEVVTGANAAATGYPDRLLDELTGLRQRLPHARLVLSGRYDLRAQVDDIDERFASIEHLELHRLDADEAEEYLRDRRKLRLDEERLEAAVVASGARRDGAQPLVLALIADAIAQQPDIPADVIRSLDEPQLFNLIQRIVVRIPDVRVRWLLRYGVVPRLLSRRLVEDVLTPFLRTGIQGTSSDDDPSRDRRPATAAEAEPFPVAADATIDPNELWTALTRYAATYSWVEPVEPDVLRFHEVVLGPMRDLLRQQPVFGKLHMAVSEYFERRAAAEPEDRSRLLREAFYHRLVLDADGALARWKKETRSMRTDPDVAAAMADEVLDLAARDPNMLTPEVIAQARTERALANLRRATAPGAARGSVLWDLAREDVEQAESACRSDVRLIACRAALLTRDGHARDALALVEPELAKPLRAEDKMILHVRRGDSFASLAAPEADAEYKAAIALGPQADARPEDLGTLHWKLAQALDGRDDVTAARAACGVGLATAPADSASHAALMLLRGRLSLRMGNPSASAPSLAAPLKHGGRLAHEARLLLAQAALAAWDGDAALRLANEAVDSALHAYVEPAEAAIELAEARELHGNVRAALWDTRGAQQDLEAAALIWDTVAGTGARRCFTAIARIHLRDSADPQRADLALQRAEAVVGDRAVVDIGMVRVRRAEWLAVGHIGEPARLIQEVLAEMRAAHAPPGVRARAAVEGLCLPERSTRPEFLHALTDALASVEPATARVGMLYDFTRCPRLTGVPADEVEKLRRLLLSENVRRQIDALPVPDRRVALVRLADVARAIGDVADSHRLIDDAYALAPNLDRSSLAYRRLTLAAVRVGAESLVDQGALSALADEGQAERPALAVPSLIEAAEELLLNDARIRNTVSKAAATAERLLEKWGVAESASVLRLPRRLRRPPRYPPLPEALKPAAPLQPTIRTEHPTLNVVLDLDNEGISVWSLPAGSTVPLEYRIDPVTNPVVAAIMRATHRPGLFDPGLPELFTDARSVGPALADVLFGPHARSLLSRQENVDVRLWTAPGILGQVPWELASSAPNRPPIALGPLVRHFYRGYLDAEHSAPRRTALQRPTVLIVRPPAGDRGAAPGLIKTTLVPLERHYEAAGMDVRILHRVDLPTLLNEFSRHPPDVVHVAAGLIDAGGGAAIDVSSGVAGELDVPGIDRERLTPTGFALALGAMPPPGPAIVLDPPAVSHLTVLTAQLLLRNAFAAEIASLATVPAVIGTGLVRFGCEDELYRQLPYALAAARPVADVVNRVRAIAETADGTPDSFGFLPTALFASCPTHAIGIGP